MAREVVIASGVRTAIGRLAGSLKTFSPTSLATRIVREALSRAEVAGNDVGHVVFGNVIQTEPRDMCLARVAALDAGVAEQAPAFTVNRLCGSGLEAIVSAARSILLGEADIAVAGGAECMSRAPYIVPSLRLDDETLIDMMTGALTDPFHRYHMGVTAENIARQFGISRDMQDALALESHRRAAHAIQNGHFAGQILPLVVKSEDGDRLFDTDEYVRFGTSPDDFSRLKPVFQKEGGTVTAGNTSGINDAAAALVLMEGETAGRRGLRPLAKLVSYAHAGVDPRIMGMGPVPATQMALARAGLTIADIDLIEANEAFAAQTCAVSQALGLDSCKVNPNGSGISLGHPIGATGALLTVKAIYELHRTGGRYALVTLCIGGGQGIAAVFERI